MKKNKYLWLLGFLIQNAIFSQSIIKGHVKDSLGVPIIAASILLKDSTNTKTILYAITNNKGFYKINNIKYIGKVYLYANSLGYKKRVESLYLSSKNIEFTNNFYLNEEIMTLQEVTIKAKRPPIRVKKDTVSYSVEKFMDGTEEVIEDVIKKLPGLDVGDNGKITYKGKPIDKVLIEGDDMFDSNYTIATKNIGSAVIDKVQAIENYQENKTLRGIKPSKKQVLNILLKDDVKAKPYGNGSFAYGYKKRFNVSLNLIGVSKKNKYYVLGRTNNIGINPSPYNHFSLASNLGKDEKSTSTIINANYFPPKIKPRRINNNKSFFGATNLIFKPNKKLRIKSNLFITKDKNILNSETRNTFITQTGSIQINENQKLIRKPLIGEGQLGIDYDISKTSEINYHTKIKIGEIKNEIKQNTSSGLFKELLTNKDVFINQELKYTSRLTDKSALLVTTSYLYNKKPQDYFVTPAILSDLISNQPDNLEKYKSFQKSKMELNEFNFQSEYIKASRKGTSNLRIEFLNTKEKLNSNLSFQNIETQNNIPTYIVNKPQNKQQHLLIEAEDIRIFNNNWSIIYGLSGNFKSISLDDIPKEQIYYLSPKLGTVIKLGGIAKLTTIYTYDREYPSLNRLYSEYILTNYRTLSKGSSNVSPISSHTFLANLSYYNWFNQFSYFMNLIYINNDKAYTSKIQINDISTLSEKILVSGNKNYIGTFEVNKFIPFILSNIKFKANLSWYNYFNVVNNSELRDNLSFSSNYKISIKSALNGIFDFETSFNLLKTVFTTSNNSGKTENKNAELFANFIIRPNKKIVIKLSNEKKIYNIGERNNSNYYFLDVDLKYTIKRNKLSFRLVGRNLLNQTSFERKSIGDYFSSIQRFNLLPRHLLLEMSYRF